VRTPLRAAIAGLIAAALAAPLWAEPLSEETKLTAEIIEAKKKLIHQIENKIDAIIDYQLVEIIPLVQ